jgi:hypothetical protein
LNLFKNTVKTSLRQAIAAINAGETLWPPGCGMVNDFF